MTNTISDWHDSSITRDIVIISTLKLEPTPDRQRQVLDVLDSVRGLTHTSPGCLACEVYLEEGPGRAILLSERWESAVALHAHLQSDLYRRVLATLEMSSMPPEIRFHHVAASEGMGLIERLRTPKAELSLGQSQDGP